MAAYDFPNSPSDGDTVTVSGVTYTYSSSKTRWDGAAASGSSTTVYATIDLLPLSGASTGDQAYVSGNNRLYLWNGSGWYNIALINTTPSISGANATYDLARDGTATTVTITATDPEGLPITFSIASDTSGNIATVTQGTGSNTNVFTITPSTNSAHAGTFSLTFRASDGVNIATAVSSFTLAFSVQYSNYTTALITSVGADSAVNNAFDDASTSNHTITATGDVTQNTFSPYRSGGYSTYISGGNDQNLYIASNTATAVESGDFTLEAWCWFDDPDEDEDRFIYTNFASWGANAFLFGKHSATAAGNGKVVFWVNNNDAAAPLLVDPNLPSAGWLHYCVTRSGNTFTLYRNGSSVATATSFTGAVTGSSNISYVGEAGDGITSFKGYLRDVRLIKGTAVTPPSGGPTEPLTAVTNTGLLTCHLPYIADGSTNDHSITVNGDVKTEPYSPYDYYEYAASDNGGSAFFDGTGDYLTVPNAVADYGTGEFRVECWLYPKAIGNVTILGNGPLTIGHWSGNLQLYNGGFRDAGHDIRNNQWAHCVWQRNSSGLFETCLNGKKASTGHTDTSSRSSTTNPRIGYNPANVEPYHGYIADMRIVIGSGAAYTADFSPPTAPISNITNTTLRLPFDDAGIIDKSQSVKSITLYGNTKSSTSYYKYLTSSMYFDGTGDYLSADANNVGDFGTQDFTAEGWFYLTGSLANYIAICETRGSGATTTGWAIAINAAGSIYVYSGAFLCQAANSSISSNTWYHWAYSRASGNHRLFIDGTQVGSTSTTSRDYTDTNFRIGGNFAGAELFTGYQSDVRITKGYARYTANFTKPSAALQG